ncbi:MAG: hypothetical protein IJ048_12500 [Clostridia bacterium]|nr:hypothetical protein [Clostridia bacterium]
MTNGSMAIKAKSLTILEDQLQSEFLACKKAQEYAGSFENPALKNLASTVAQHHRERFDRLFDYLNSHA